MADSKRTDRIRKALEAIEKKHKGHLTPQAVVDEARDRKHPLHAEFPWDDKEAAKLARLDIARRLIRCVTVTVINRAQRFTSVVYVKNPDRCNDEAGYVATTSKQLDREQSMGVLVSELARIEGQIERARGIAAALDGQHPGLLDQLDSMLEQLVSVQRNLEAAA